MYPATFSISSKNRRKPQQHLCRMTSNRLVMKAGQGNDDFITWRMVGAGQRTTPMCGDVRSWTDRCPTGLEGHLNKPFKVSCHKVSCPECYEPVISVMAHNAKERIALVRKAYYMAGYVFEQGEIILSPPKSEYSKFATKQGYDAVRRRAVDYATKYCGMAGALVAVHQYRGRKWLMDDIRTGKREAADSWHFHIYGLSIPRTVVDETGRERLADGVMNSRDFNAMTAPRGSMPGKNGGYSDGWTYKWVGEYTRNGKLRNVYEKIRYELDHAALYHNGERFGPVCSWSGILAATKVSREKTVTVEPLLCPECGRQCVRMFEDEVKGPSEIRHEIFKYNVKRATIDRCALRYKLLKGPERSETLITESISYA